MRLLESLIEKHTSLDAISSTTGAEDAIKLGGISPVPPFDAKPKVSILPSLYKTSDAPSVV
jgi:hypothetical protein